jgi:hypothetical protein
MQTEHNKLDRLQQLVASQKENIVALRREVATLRAALDRVQAAAVRKERDVVPTPQPCPRCQGCGQLVNDNDETPWSAWDSGGV